jgi:hypothetical protein
MLNSLTSAVAAKFGSPRSARAAPTAADSSAGLARSHAAHAHRNAANTASAAPQHDAHQVNERFAARPMIALPEIPSGPISLTLQDGRSSLTYAMGMWVEDAVFALLRAGIDPASPHYSISGGAHLHVSPAYQSKLTLHVPHRSDANIIVDQMIGIAIRAGAIPSKESIADLCIDYAPHCAMRVDPFDGAAAVAASSTQSHASVS